MESIDIYFSWLVGLVYKKSAEARLSTHGKLLRYLFEKPFIVRVPLDQNRLGDGASLRWVFYKETGIEDPIQDDDYCSMLEMMVALANRCECDIMANDTYGDRTKIWFWSMVKSLGLADQTDDIFDESYCDGVIERFLKGEYGYDGTGGLFELQCPHYDIHNTELWMQLQWFLKERKGNYA